MILYAHTIQCHCRYKGALKKNAQTATKKLLWLLMQFFFNSPVYNKELTMPLTARPSHSLRLLQTVSEKSLFLSLRRCQPCEKYQHSPSIFRTPNVSWPQRHQFFGFQKTPSTKRTHTHKLKTTSFREGTRGSRTSSELFSLRAGIREEKIKKQPKMRNMQKKTHTTAHLPRRPHGEEA